MGQRVALTGNDAGAVAFKQVNPDVAAVYPITPQTELMHEFARFAADGEVDTILVPVESEHSAMSASVGAAAAGARAITATSSQGLALMHEVVYIAAALRLPIVMVNINRALSAPINIHCDHSDSMAERDSGWVQLFSENAQEAYDNTIQAFRIAENKKVLLPVMVTLDGFIISHTVETMETEPDEMVKKFVGTYEPEHHLLNPQKPITVGALDLQDWYFEHKRQEVDGMSRATEVIKAVGAEYGKLTGRSYGLIETYKMDDAEFAIIVLGSTAGTAKVACDAVRDKGVAAGVLKIRSFRPFPGREIAAALAKTKAIAVFDRSFSIGLEGGPVFAEVRSCLQGAGLLNPVVSYVYGLGGRDIFVEDIAKVFGEDLAAIARAGKVKQVENYIGLRE